MIDWILWRATRISSYTARGVFVHSQIGRYLDGEEEREGLYR